MILITLDKTTLVGTPLNLNKDIKDDWLHHKTALKSAKFKWNDKNKRWEMDVPMWSHDTYNILKMFAEVKILPEVQELINKWDDIMPSQLQKYEVQPFDWLEFSYFPPYVGKHPYEDYQKEDILKALSQNRELFDWEMGLGKSYATVIIYEYYKKFKGTEKMLLFSSNIGTRNLKDELVKLDRNLTEDDIEVFTKAKSFTGFRRKWGKGYKNTRLIFDLDVIQNKKVLVFSYDAWVLVHNAYVKHIREEETKAKKAKLIDKITHLKDIRIPIEKFSPGVPMLCLDECHNLQNPKSDRSRVLDKYLNKFPYRYMFSATPADVPEKLYYMGRILDPRIVKFLKYDDWLHKYNDIGTIFSKFAINPRKWHWEDLNKVNAELEKYTTVRTADDCLVLPKSEVVAPFYVEMDEDLENIYKSFVNYVINYSIQIGGDIKTIKDVIREKFVTIQSLLENPKVLLRTGQDLDAGTRSLIEKYKDSESNKFDVVDDIIEERESYNDRGIIWYVHPETGKALEERYKNKHPVLVSSDLSDEERAKRIKEFQKDEKHKILIADLLILNTSLTLNEANYGVYVENSFAYQIYFQSTGRIKRIGQTKHTYIYHMFYKNTIDLFHKKTIDNKADFSNALFNSNAWLGMDIKGLKEFFEGNFEID